MRTKLIILIIPAILFALFLSKSLAQTKKNESMENRWKKVEEYKRKSLPESALKEVELILMQAQKEKDPAEIIKALVHKMRFTLDKNPDEAKNLIREFEELAVATEDKAAQAVMYSMTAELYKLFYQENEYRIRQRRELQGVVPEDMNEWTKNLFVDQICRLGTLSLQNADVLKNSSVDQFEAILVAGKDSHELQPTLFHLLSYRFAVMLNEFSNNEVAESEDFSVSETERLISEIYDNLIAFNREIKNPAGLVYAQLKALEFKHNRTGSEFIDALDALEKEHKGEEAQVEILAEKANYHLHKNYFTDEAAMKAGRRMAYDIAAYGLKNYPNYKRIAMLENVKMQIEQKEFSVEHKGVVKPRSKLVLELRSTNMDALQLDVWRVNATAEDYFNHLSNQRDKKSLYPNRKAVDRRTIQIDKDPDFGSVETEIELIAGDYGIYEYRLGEKNVSDSEQVRGYFVVTDLAYIQRSEEANFYDLFVLDRVEGSPLKGVKIKYYRNEWSGKKYTLKSLGENRSDEKGFASQKIERSGSVVLFFEKDDDRWYSSNTNMYHRYSNTNTKIDENRERAALFTDRSLYRPGQALYFKGIVYKDILQKVVAGKSVRVELFNVNNEKVGEKDVKTNEFGSFEGEFILPEGGVNGAYTLRGGGASNVVWVEEYKRPMFEVKLNKPKEEIRFGETLTVKGEAKAYSGYALPDTEVKYRVVRRPHHYWWWGSAPERIVADGTVKSDENGQFEISFTPEKSKSENISLARNNQQFYTYSIIADVTDGAGETQSGEVRVSVGDRSLFILAEVPGKIENKKSAINVLVSAETLNGEKVKTEISYRLIEMKPGDAYYEEASFGEKSIELRTVSKGKIQSGEKLPLNLSKEKSGYYKFVFTAQDQWKREVKVEHNFVLYSAKDKSPAVKSYKWVKAPASELELGEKTALYFGTSTKNSSLLYEVYAGKERVERRWVKLSDEIKEFPLEFSEAYSEGMTIMLTMVKDEQVFNEQFKIRQKQKDKKLTPTVSVFRDKLKPGETAEWTINIPQASEEKLQAEMLVSMYDASLDAIRPHNWFFNPRYTATFHYISPWQFSGSQTQRDFAYYAREWKSVPELSLDDINWFNLPLGYGYGRNQMIVTGMGRALKSAPVMMAKEESVRGDVHISIADLAAQSEETGAVGAVDMAEHYTVSVLKDSAIDEVKEIPLRENFNETAFFYPQLHTDANGNVQFSFTVPESLTRWNVMMLAHTQELYFGQETMQAITQKELMVQMNLPRFVRKSDKLVLAANVVNLSEEEQEVKTRLEIINPENDKTLQLFAEGESLVIAAGSSKTVEWELDALGEVDLAVVKVVAYNENFSDGEQKYLPVLPDKVLVTESQTLTMRPNQTRTFNFESFTKNFKKVDTQNFSVEFTSNPTWYAVQALPTLANPENVNAIDYLAAYYANTLAAFIANSNPKLKATFDQWKNVAGGRDALLSNLEKNKELKLMLLEETPWLTDAKDETEQKRQIALLFDINRQADKSQQQFNKLLDLQQPNGGFSWYPGMQPSRYITQEILLNLARLNKMIDKKRDGREEEMVKKALAWLDRELARDFEELKKRNKNYHNQRVIGDLQLFYLHMRSEYPEIAVLTSSKAAYEFYTAQAEKYWTDWTLYGKAMMAVVAHRNGNDLVKNQIMESLKENALNDDELGMYWAKNRAGWWWYERPIKTQTAIIEAVGEISGTVPELDEMKIWLLKQKQTQRWESPIATVNAIYALLNFGDNWLESTGEVEISLGGKPLQIENREAGTGYFKQTVANNELQPESGKITVETSGSNTIGWGAAYWQYFQNQEEITAVGKEIQISKSLFVERIVNGKKTIVPLAQSEAKRGDKLITRLVLTTDRDMEYVLLKDLRAASLEPVEQTSGYRYKEGAGYYYTIKDASTQFFFDYLLKGTYVFEHESWINNSGEFTSGITSVQCLYAPEFVAHTGGERMVVK